MSRFTGNTFCFLDWLKMSSISPLRGFSMRDRVELMLIFLGIVLFLGFLSLLLIVGYFVSDDPGEFVFVAMVGLLALGFVATFFTVLFNVLTGSLTL